MEGTTQWWRVDWQMFAADCGRRFAAGGEMGRSNLVRSGVSWRIGRDETCSRCEASLTNRQVIDRTRPGLGVGTVCVACVSPEEWHQWLGAPRTGRKSTVHAPGARKRSDTLERAIQHPRFVFTPCKLTLSLLAEQPGAFGDMTKRQTEDYLAAARMVTAESEAA